MHDFQAYFSTTFQELKLLFRGLSRMKVIFRDFPVSRSRNFQEKIQDFLGCVGTLYFNWLLLNTCMAFVILHIYTYVKICICCLYTIHAFLQILFSIGHHQYLLIKSVYLHISIFIDSNQQRRLDWRPVDEQSVQKQGVDFQ